MCIRDSDENGNLITYSETFENTDGKDQAGIDGQRDETTATMQDFLSQLTMRVYNGSELIYESSPDQAGALAENVLLGTLSAGEALDVYKRQAYHCTKGKNHNLVHQFSALCLLHIPSYYHKYQYDLPSKSKHLHRYIPVSYTHLDVYKRQVSKRRNHTGYCSSTGKAVFSSRITS